MRVPAANTICLGPDDTFHGLSSAPTPTVTADTAANSVTVDYGSFANLREAGDAHRRGLHRAHPGRAVPHQLLLVNQMQSSYRTTSGETRSSTAVAPFEVDAPALSITKGVVGSTNPDTTFTGGPRQPGGGITSPARAPTAPRRSRAAS